jgi:8-oxo-dGTP pyrophosphatase MutT (NUDIX family)
MAKTLQVAALPWRQTENGIEILLVTTRTTKRWLIPKGWTMEGKADFEAAAIEAFEEAGVRGVVEPLPIGQFGYLKTLQSGKPRHVKVDVFAIEVEQELDEWPERHERERRWYAVPEAIARVEEPELVPVLQNFDWRSISNRKDKWATHSLPAILWRRLRTWMRKLVR